MRYTGRVGLIAVPLLALLNVGAAENSVSLTDAVKSQNVTAMRALIKQRADVNAREVDGTTPLHWAAYNGDDAAVEMLLKAGANPNTTNRYGVTPLSLACETGNARIIERLLKAGADVNASRPGGETPLMTAANQGNPEVLRLLLAQGADPNAMEETRGQTALMWAATRNNAAAVKVLTETGAKLDLHARGPKFRENVDSMAGCSAIGVTVEQTREQCTSKFFQDPAGRGGKLRPRVDQYTAVMFAARKGANEALRTLLEAGANPNEMAEDGMTAVVVAAFNANWEGGVILVEHGANPNADQTGWTALHQIARTRGLSGWRLPNPVVKGKLQANDFAKALIAAGADVNARVKKPIRGDQERGRFIMIGATPILIAAKSFDTDLMRLLAANGADVNARNAYDSTILILAAGNEVSNVEEDMGSYSDGLAATQLAWELGNDVNAINEEGNTPLHGAGYIGNVGVIDFLVSKGANIDVENFHEGVDGKGWTPLAMTLQTLSSGAQPLAEAALRKYHAAQGIPIKLRTWDDLRHWGLKRGSAYAARTPAAEKKQEAAAQPEKK